jgi:integrase
MTWHTTTVSSEELIDFLTLIRGQGGTVTCSRPQSDGLKAGDLLFATREGTPFSRNTFRTRVWRPAVAASGVDFHVRVHDLRHAHASWLLAGGSDLKSVMDRMGHAQITTTQKYLHTLPDADSKNLTALDRIRNSAPESRPDPAG